jgi:Protein of unknown function (DUF2905)
MLPQLARIFLIIGIFFIVIAGVLYLASRFNLPLGKLPGDIQIQGKNYTCFFPLGTSILLSLLLSLVLFIVQYITRK